MKLPAFQFYPGDWRKDTGVQSLPYDARGVWIEILCLMHESEERGKLTLAGKPMPDEALARLLGLDAVLLKQILTTLVEHGVTSRDPDTGALICRRMVRDEKLRKTRANCGKQGGNPVLLNQNPTTGVKQKPTPSSSSSSSSSDSITATPAGVTDKAALKGRPRNELIDALVAVDGSDPLQATQPAFKQAATALRDIKAVNPGVTVAEIRARAAEYSRRNPTWTISSSALAKHWAASGPRGKAPVRANLPEPDSWRAWLNETAPDSVYAHGKAHEGTQWGELDRATQDWITKGMRKSA